ncbi:hypothetical protein [Aquabacter cavernae]|nr:hypothetical protein [Aquabacter cavernae]
MVSGLLKGVKPDPKIINIPLIGVTPQTLDGVDRSKIQPPKGWRP